MDNTALRRHIAWLLAALTAIAWAFFVVVGYYVVHKPFGLDNALALLRTALDLLVWLLLLAAAGGLGWRLTRRWPGRIAPLEDGVLSLGLGLGLLSLLTLALGLAGGLVRWLFWPLTLGLAASSLPRWRDWLSRLRASPLLKADTRLEQLLAAYLSPSLGLIFLAALAPPTAWDSLVYHLTGPSLYVAQGRIGGGIDLPYLGFPALVDTLFAAALLLRGPVVAQLVHLTYLLLALLAIYALAGRYLSRRAGWLGMAALVSAPTIALLAGWAYVDLAALFYELLAFYLLLLWDDAPNDQKAARLAAAGLACGLAMGVKYTAVLLPAAVGGVVLWRSRRAGRRALLQRGLLLGGVAALTAAPWFLKNWALTGNPVYPFFLPGQFWDDFRAWFYSRPGTGLAATAPWRLLIAPWEATVRGVEGAAGYSATIGPLLLIAVPLLPLVWRSLTAAQKKIVALAAAIAAPQYLFWLYGVAWSALLVQTRLLFPIFGLLALLAGLALARLRRLDRPRFAPGWLLSAVVVLALGLDLSGAAWRFAGDNPLAYLAGWESADDYLARHLPAYYPTISYLNHELPATARVYFLWEPRSFYCQRAARPDAILDGFLHLRHRFGDAAAIDHYLRQAGYSHVLVHEAGYRFVLQDGFDPVGPDDVAVLEALRRDFWQPVMAFGDVYTLYALPATTAAPG